MLPSIYHTNSPEETVQLGQKLAQHLSGGSTVLLYGNLGVGKTHFSKGIAKGLGIEGIIKSPTFAYVNSYPLEGRGEGKESLPAPSSQLPAFHHYDLYRLSPGDDLSSIGFDDTLNDPEAINVIEWADRMGELPADHIRVELSSGGGVLNSEEGSGQTAVGESAQKHQLAIQFHSTAITPASMVAPFWDEWKTPEHVRAHCRQVASVALQLGQAMVQAGEIIDLNVLNTAALLHDMARVCDFKTMDRSHFSEAITDEKWEQWLQLREQFKGQRHGDIAAHFLQKKGQNRTAHLIAYHHFIDLINHSTLFDDDLELAIVYYADKRVKHHQIVSVADRLSDGRERYLQSESVEKMEESKKIENLILSLEKRLFEGVGIRPGDIK